MLPSREDVWTTKIRLDYMQGRIFACRDGNGHNFVRVCSHDAFYIAQIDWSINTVAKYWYTIVSKREHMLPASVPLTVRFCLSWIIGHDCTNTVEWPTHKFHSWLHTKLGVYERLTTSDLEGVFVDDLRDISHRRLSEYHSLYVMRCDPPVYTDRYRKRPFSDKEMDVINQLSLLRFAREGRRYECPREVYAAFRF